MACPLYKATSTEGKFIEWNDERQADFDELKRRLTDTNNVFALPNFDQTFVLETVASDVGIGAVISQSFNGQEKPIAYFSRHLNKAEKNYPTSEKVLLAIVKSVEHFSKFLYGKKFIIRTDHRPLSWIMNTAKPASRLARWLILLSNYEFDIDYRPGRVNSNADALSRLVKTDEPDVEIDPPGFQIH